MTATHRKKPVEIEARQLIGSTTRDADTYQWVEANTQGSFDFHADIRPAHGVSIDPSNGFMVIATLEGDMTAKPGDWIIRGIQGEFYPCKPDIFAATYEPVESPAICLECAYGKHVNCDGTALNEDTDEIVPCDCVACTPVQPEPTAAFARPMKEI